MLGDVDDEAQIVLDEQRSRRLIPLLECGESGAFGLLFQRRRQHVAPADVKKGRRLDTEDGQDALPQESDLRFT